ncbi:MAG: VPS10 domain-containing protein, partial [Longimicrobiales bacterium]
SYTIYAGAASGGVWKTVNEGVTWEPVFDQAASTSIGDVAIAPSDPSILWVGTGEANIFRSSMAGAGIYKSTDAGETWTHMGLAGTHTIARIRVHPTNPDIVWVAASGHEWTSNPERGVFMTTDGGQTWEKVLYVDENTGAIDLVLDPSNPDNLYAATWQRVRKKWHDPRSEAGYTGSGIHRSTDGGRTWTPINEGLPAPDHRGRIGLGIARSSPNVLYAFVDNYDIAREPEPGQFDSYGRPLGPVIRGATVFRSDDSGDSWREVSEHNSYMERLSATYGWVFGQIRVDPNDPDRIYVMGLGLNVSDDGGRTFRRLTGMHGDHHGLWIDPDNSDYLINVNDGGLYISYDAGENWRFNEDVPVVQFFNVAYDMASPFHVYGSIQDHGSRRGVVDLSRGRNDIPAVDFEDAPGGEGSNQAIDPRDPNIVYSAGFYGNISRTNLATDEEAEISPEPAEGELPLRGQWLAPFILSPHNPDVLYHGFQMLHRSMDRGETWERISEDLTYNDPAKLGDIPYQTIFSIAESPLRFGVIYAGTDDGRVHLTRDGGQTWSEIGQQLPQGKFIAEIVPSRTAEGTVYLAQNGKRDDDFTPYLWKSTDFGATWTSIVNDLPAGPVNVIKEDPKNANVLYVGTDIGVYVSLNGGQNWQALPADLPSTFVHDIVIHPRDDILVAATHGRGLFALDVRPLQQLTPEVLAADVFVLTPETALLPANGQPAIQPAIHYWLGSAGDVSVTVQDATGATVKQLEATGDAGLNAAEWDLTGPVTEQEPQEGGFDRDGPPRVEPGVYTVEVRQGDNSATAVVQVSR